MCARSRIPRRRQRRLRVTVHLVDGRQRVVRAVMVDTVPGLAATRALPPRGDLYEVTHLASGRKLTTRPIPLNEALEFIDDLTNELRHIDWDGPLDRLDAEDVGTIRSMLGNTARPLIN